MTATLGPVNEESKDAVIVIEESRKVTRRNRKIRERIRDCFPLEPFVYFSACLFLLSIISLIAFVAMTDYLGVS